MIGRICRTERADLLVVPYREVSGSHFSCVVVNAPEDSRYPVGGYDISVPRDQLTPVPVKNVCPNGQARVIEVRA